jgi:hypothetical protein
MANLKKKEKSDKGMESKMKEKNLKIENLMSEIQKIKSQRLDLDKKLREEAQNYTKGKIERQKELVSTKKELFKKNMDLQKQKNHNRKIELDYKKKLLLLRPKTKETPHKKTKLALPTEASLGLLSLESFSEMMQLFCHKIIEHVDIENEIQQRQDLLQHETLKINKIFEEIALLEIEKDQFTVEEELEFINSKMKELENNADNIDSLIDRKVKHLDKLEGELDDLKSFINNGFANILTFLCNNKIDKEMFWETALNILMYELEVLKRSENKTKDRHREVEIEKSEIAQSHGELKKTYAILEKEYQRYCWVDSIV